MYQHKTKGHAKMRGEKRNVNVLKEGNLYNVHIPITCKKKDERRIGEESFPACIAKERGR